MSWTVSHSKREAVSDRGYRVMWDALGKRLWFNAWLAGKHIGAGFVKDWDEAKDFCDRHEASRSDTHV